MKTHCFNFNKIDFLVKNKFYLFLLLIISSSNLIFARQLTPDEALQKYREEKNIQTYLTRSIQEPKLIEQFNATKGNEAALYVFETPEKQRLVLSASDRVPALLGYYDNSSQTNEEMPEALRWWLSQYAEQITYIENNPLIINDIETFSNEESKAIGPLLTTQWGQGSPYNSLCPIKSGSRTVTGCVATAFAQVMNYHKWPLRGEGKHSYVSGGYSYTIDFSSIEFDWGNMENTYSQSSSSKSIEAVAQLMKACGYAVDMDYGVGGSGAVTTKVLNANKYFNYSENAYFADRNYYSTPQWEELIIDQLSKGLPIIYSGRDGIWSNSIGHCFVCDGYDGNGYFHFNWGWEGYCDGYFLLTSLVPNGVGIGGSLDGYNYNQQCCFDFYPAKNESPRELTFFGQDFSISDITDSNFQIYTNVYGEIVVKESKKMTLGIEFNPQKGSSIYYTVKDVEFSSNNVYYGIGRTISKNTLQSLGLNDGIYRLRFVYTIDNKIWNPLIYPFDQASEAIITLKGDKFEIQVEEKENPLKIYDIRFNGGRTIVKDLNNTLSYKASNSSDEPIYFASRHYLLTSKEATSISSLYNTNLILMPHEEKTISLPIPYNNLFGFTKGEYILKVNVGEDFNKMINYYSDYSFKIIDSSEALSDDCFKYIESGENQLIIFALQNSKLRGDVILPDKVTLNGTQYEVVDIMCSLNELLDIPNLESLDIKTPITKIPSRAFSNAQKLNNINIPATVTSIGSYAFSNCQSLKTVKLPENLSYIPEYLFYGCSELSAVNIPQTINYIGESAFNGCSSLKSEIILPEEITRIEPYTFMGCNLIPTISLSSNIDYIGLSAFEGCSSIKTINLPTNLKEIIVSTFRNCASLESINIPISTEIISGYAFSGCSSLKNIEIPESVKTIGSGAFYYCTSLETIIIPQDVERIETYTFSGCNNLKKINLPQTLSYIGRSAFSDCSALKEIKLPESICEIEESAFYKCISLTNITIPSNISEINNNTFQYCSALASVNLPENLKAIGNYAFEYCSELKDIVFPDHLSTIGNYSFSHCKGITDIIFPASISAIGSRAFSDCLNLKNMKMAEKLENSESLILGDYAFSYCSNLEKAELCVGINEIPIGLFYNCRSLNTAPIPETVTKINTSAFYDCPLNGIIKLPKNIQEIANNSFYLFDGYKIVECEAQTPPKLSYIAFTNNTYKKGRLRVPEELISRYENAENWKNFNKISFIGEILVESITVEKDLAEIRTLHTFSLNPTVYPSNATEKGVLWSSSKPYVAIINEYGIIEAKSTGSTIITGSAADGGGAIISFELQVLPLLKGDSNDNDVVTVADAVNTANYAVGIEVESFMEQAADVNNDGKITMSDASGTITIILNDPGSLNIYTRAMENEEIEYSSLSISDFLINKNISQSVSIGLDNSEGYVALQGDIILPEGMSLENISIGEELKTSHFLMYKEISSQRYRFVIFSSTNISIPQNCKSIIDLTLNNCQMIYDNLLISNVICADSEGKDHKLQNSTKSGYETAEVSFEIQNKPIITPVNDGILILNGAGQAYSIYNLSGMLMKYGEIIDKEEHIFLVSGIYWINVGNQKAKVLVK